MAVGRAPGGPSRRAAAAVSEGEPAGRGVVAEGDGGLSAGFSSWARRYVCVAEVSERPPSV